MIAPIRLPRRQDLPKFMYESRALPWFPSTTEELATYGHDRVRLGHPEEGASLESLRTRYAEVIAGVAITRWTESDYLDVCMEWALADLIACYGCKGICRTFTGGNTFMALHSSRSEESGKPVFRMAHCPGPVQRLRQIREAKRRASKWDGQVPPSQATATEKKVVS